MKKRFIASAVALFLASLSVTGFAAAHQMPTPVKRADVSNKDVPPPLPAASAARPVNASPAKPQRVLASPATPQVALDPCHLTAEKLVLKLGAEDSDSTLAVRNFTKCIVAYSWKESWLQISSPDADILQLSAAENKQSDSRTSVITIVGKSNTLELTVRQAGGRVASTAAPAPATAKSMPVQMELPATVSSTPPTPKPLISEDESH